MIAPNSLSAEEDNLPPRSRLWRIGLAEDLRDPAFVKAFLRALTAEGVAVERPAKEMFHTNGGKTNMVRTTTVNPRSKA